MTNDQWFFTCLLFTCISSFGKMSLQIFCQFLNWFFVLLLNYKHFKFTWDASHIHIYYNNFILTSLTSYVKWAYFLKDKKYCHWSKKRWKFDSPLPIRVNEFIMKNLHIHTHTHTQTHTHKQNTSSSPRWLHWPILVYI